MIRATLLVSLGFFLLADDPAAESIPTPSAPRSVSTVPATDAVESTSCAMCYEALVIAWPFTIRHYFPSGNQFFVEQQPTLGSEGHAPLTSAYLEGGANSESAAQAWETILDNLEKQTNFLHCCDDGGEYTPGGNMDCQAFNACHGDPPQVGYCQEYHSECGGSELVEATEGVHAAVREGSFALLHKVAKSHPKFVRVVADRGAVQILNCNGAILQQEDVGAIWSSQALKAL